MEVKIINESMKGLWEQYINNNPYSIAWQSYKWSNVLKEHYRFEFYPIAAFNGSDICGILPLYYIKTTLGQEALISVPYAVAGGIVADSESIKKSLLDKAIEISKQHNSCKIILKQYKIKINEDLRTDDNFYNSELSLSDGVKGAWNKISDINKEKIESAGKYNLTLEYPSEDINGFYELLLTHHHKTGVPCTSKKWIKSLIDSKMYSFAVLKHNEKITAGTMVKEFKKTVSFPFTCIMDRSEENISFAYNMYWKLIEQYASKGYEIFHSGRIPKNDMAEEYRLGWGGEKNSYYYQYYPNCTSKTEYSTKKGKKRELFESCWKLMPRGIAKIVGPHIVKQFP